MKRITEKQLQFLVDQINEAANAPKESYTKLSDGKYRANIGNYHLNGAYGGVALHCMHNAHGGVVDVFGSGHMTKRELYGRLQTYLWGIHTGKELKK